MKLRIESLLIASAATLMFNGGAGAQNTKISDDVVKIGVLTDMSGQFSHESGEGSVTVLDPPMVNFCSSYVRKKKVWSRQTGPPSDPP